MRDFGIIHPKKFCYEIESSASSEDKLRSKELKWLMSNAFAIYVIRSRILCSLNKTDVFIFPCRIKWPRGKRQEAYRAHYVRQHFQRERDYEVASENYDFPKLPVRTVELVKHGPTCVGKK